MQPVGSMSRWSEVADLPPQSRQSPAPSRAGLRLLPCIAGLPAMPPSWATHTAMLGCLGAEGAVSRRASWVRLVLTRGVNGESP